MDHEYPSTSFRIRQERHTKPNSTGQHHIQSTCKVWAIATSPHTMEPRTRPKDVGADFWIVSFPSNGFCQKLVSTGHADLNSVKLTLIVLAERRSGASDLNSQTAIIPRPPLVSPSPNSSSWRPPQCELFVRCSTPRVEQQPWLPLEQLLA
jgi:hypothetical protein